MKLVIEMSLDNAAFEDGGRWEEVRRILAVAPLQFLESPDDETYFFDINGNKVGTARIVED